MDSDQMIARLQQQIDELKTQQVELNHQLARAQRDLWQNRVEDLEVQFHLGAMEANDRAALLLDEVRGRWAELRVQLDGAASTATEVGETLRAGLESATRDLRTALLESRARISASSRN